MRAIYITTDNEIALASVDPDNLLKDLQNAVGGWIEAVNLTDNITMWINEEGKLNNLPLNVTATLLYHTVYGPYDLIVGNVILTGGPDDDGNTTEIDLNELSALGDRADQYAESL